MQIQSNKGVAYIATPYRAKNFIQKIKYIKYAKKITKEAIENGYIPITTHLYLTRVLKDRKPTERKLGLATGQQLLVNCDCMIVGVKYGISQEMEAEMDLAQDANIPIKIFEREARELTRKKDKLERDLADYTIDKNARERKKHQRRMAKCYFKKAMKCMF